MDIAVLLKGFSTLSWAAVAGLIIYAIVRSSRGRGIKSLSGVIIAVVVAAVIITTLSAGLVFIRPEERGVVLSAVASEGYRQEVLTPGLRWVIPFAETVITYPISKQT